MIFELMSGILICDVVRYMQDYVVLSINFEGLETEYETIPIGNFNGLEQWVDDNYTLVKN